MALPRVISIVNVRLLVAPLGSKEDPANARGKILESFFKDILEAAGYEGIDLRVKENGAEYDVTAKHSVGSESVVGEAKAWSRNVPLEAVSSFAGKMIPQWANEPKTLGLLITITNLTAEAKDYYRETKKTHNFKVLEESDLVDLLRSKRHVIDPFTVAERCQQGYDRQTTDSAILLTNRGAFVVVLLRESGNTLPTSFAMFDHVGNAVTDSDALREVARDVTFCSGLAPIDPSSKAKAVERTAIGFILGGEGWFDYRLPASPAFFVGRPTQLERLRKHVKGIQDHENRSRLVQILSRSGVGKSSFVLKAKADLDQNKIPCLAVDARNVRTEIDLLAVLQEFAQLHGFVGDKTPPSLQDGFRLAVNLAGRGDAVSCLVIDQFEALFPRQGLFHLVMDLIQESLHAGFGLFFVIARKNDQPTTYDDNALVDVSKLRSIADTILLDDFTKDEAIELISHAKDSLGKELGKHLSNQVLEFSGGFPWLHKRTLSHVIDLVEAGESEEEILAKGLRLDELFQAELAALDEIEKAFLKNMVSLLPASFEELADEFEDGVQLSKILQSLQDKRFIRLAGRTYDTNNDFFKEWLKTGVAPLEFRYIFRIPPKQVFKALKVIGDNKTLDFDALSQKLKKKPGSVFNLLRELRMLGVIEYSKGVVSVPADVAAAIQANEIGSLIQTRVARNELVRAALLRISLARGVNISEITSIVKERFPFVEAMPETWGLYARLLVAWMKEVNLVFKRRDIVFPREVHESPDFIRAIRRVPFIPGGSFDESRRTFAALSASPAKKLKATTSVDKSLGDLRTLGLIEGNAPKVTLTPLGGDIKARGEDAFGSYVADHLRNQEYVKQFLSRVAFAPRAQQVDLYAEVLQPFVEVSWTPVTLHWRYKRFLNWLRATRLVEIRKGKVESPRRRQTQLDAFKVSGGTDSKVGARPHALTDF